VLRIWGQRTLSMSFGLWLERTTEMRRLRGVCSKVVRRMLSLRYSFSFKSWRQFLLARRLWTSRLFEADRVLRRRYFVMLRSSFLNWFHYIKFVYRIRTIGKIVFSRYRHDILLNSVWSWRWSISYRQLGLEKMQAHRIKSQLSKAFKIMRLSVNPSRSWLMDRFQTHISMSRVFDAWAAASSLSYSNYALAHRHYWSPFLIAWRQETSISVHSRNLVMRRSLKIWQALVQQRRWISISSLAFNQISFKRLIRTVFKVWCACRLQTRLAKNFHLRFVVMSWHCYARLIIGARLFTSHLKTRKMHQALHVWRSAVNAVRLAPVRKLHAYALAASRRAIMSQSSTVQSVGGTLPSGTSRASQIPWRS
jgi:hypothetical protein